MQTPEVREEPTNGQPASLWKRFKEPLATLGAIGGAVVAFVGVVYVCINYIDNRVEAKLTDPAILKKVAIASRPEMIVDAKGVIHLDRGAMAHIADFKVETDKENPALIKTLTISPTHYMATAPLVSSVDGAVFAVAAQRGPKFDWVFTFYYGSFLELQSSEIGQAGQNRIRLEITDY